MSGLGRQLNAEFAKLWSTTTWWLLALVLVGYSALMAGVMAFFLGELGQQLMNAGGGVSPDLPVSQQAAIVYSTTTTIGYVFPLLVGALAVTGELRHRTLAPTFLAQPRRGVVVAAKGIALFAVGAVYGIAGSIGSVAAGAGVFLASGQGTALGEPEILAELARIVLAMGLWGVIGVALGSLITNQVAVIIVVLAFTQFLEPILRTFGGLLAWTADVAKFLPGAATDALAGAGLYSSIGELDPAAGQFSTLLEWWQGGLVLLAIAGVAFAASFATTWRRDVT